MKDAALDLQIQEVTSLMSELKSFRDIVVSTLNTEVVAPENEERLNKLKQAVPEAAKKLYSDLCENYDETPEQVVESVSDLPRLIKFTELEKRKLMEAWHKYYMKLYFILGTLTSRKERVESLSVLKLKTRSLIFNPATIIIILGAIIFLVFVLLFR